MPLRQIHHVDIVAHAGAVGGVIIIAEHAKLFQPAQRRLGDVGHQVIGDAGGILPDEAGFVRANGVEVTQQHHRPCGVGRGDIAQNLLTHEFGPAVGVGAAQRRILVHRHGGTGLIHRSRGGKDEPFDVVARHHAAQGNGAVEVVAVVAQGNADRLAYRLEARKVNHPIKGMMSEYFVQPVAVTQIKLVEGEAFSGQLLHPANGLLVGVDEVVYHHNLVPCAKQLQASMGADIASTAGYQYVHDSSPYYYIKFD